MEKLSLIAFVAMLGAALLLPSCDQQQQPTAPQATDDATSEFLGIGKAAGPATLTYGPVTLSGGYQDGNFPAVWDLTCEDLVITFKYDANGLVDDAGAHAWAEFGIRQFGSSNFNPTWMAEGAGVWLATDYDWNVNTFDPDPTGAPNLDLDDKLILQKGGGMGEGAYNLPSVPPAPGNNHRIWFDRDGVDQWQAQSPLAVDGGNYNTGGIYNIEIRLHAVDATNGTAYLTINGLAQGFETNNDWNTMELTPAGMTFTGDMTKMQVFYGIFGYGGIHSVTFTSISISGCLGTIIIGGCDTQVLDFVYKGKAVSERINDCAVGAKNHGQFVSCVTSLTNELKKAGLITGEEKGKIVSCAAQANIP